MLSMCPLCLPFPLKHPLSLPPCGKTSHFAALLQQILQNLFVGEEQSPKDPVGPGWAVCWSLSCTCCDLHTRPCSVSKWQDLLSSPLLPCLILFPPSTSCLQQSSELN